MSSILKVDTIQDASGNAIISSDGSGNISIPNLTTTGDINFGDNDKAVFGAGSDLQIYHDGSDSYIKDAGTGDVFLQVGTRLIVEDVTDGSNIIVGDATAETSLFYAGTKKLETTNTGIDVTGTVVSDGLTVDTDTLFVDSTNNRVGVGTLTPAATLDVDGGLNCGFLQSSSSIYASSVFRNTGGGSAASPSIQPGNDNDTGMFWAASNTIGFTTAGNERMRIGNSGDVLIGQTSADFSVEGTYIGNGGLVNITNDSAAPLQVNRLTNDGPLINFYQDSTKEGDIRVSGATVSLSGFTGSHWSRLSDNSKPTILKGTILESLDEMCDWYQVQFDITDDEGNIINKKERYALSDNENVDDVITYNYDTQKKDDDGNNIIQQVQATIIQEEDIKHTKSKISDTVDAKNVYGVFFDWDNDDDTVNDMLVAQTGSYVIRINGSETVSKGDLIQSNGDGTGKVQSDDIIRASTVAKVISTTKVETYDDGSYIVPCTLHC